MTSEVVSLSEVEEQLTSYETLEAEVNSSKKFRHVTLFRCSYLKPALLVINKVVWVAVHVIYYEQKSFKKYNVQRRKLKEFTTTNNATEYINNLLLFFPPMDAHKTYCNDFSDCNQTEVYKIIQLKEEKDAAIQQVIGAFQQAKELNKKISIAGATHSQGGQSLLKESLNIDTTTLNFITLLDCETVAQFYPESYVNKLVEQHKITNVTNYPAELHTKIEENNKKLEENWVDFLDIVPNQYIEVGCGAYWYQIIPFLDSRGYAVEIMQSNNCFTVGGTISVNAHGWQHARHGISESVLFLHVVADGNHIYCSRSENEKLFHAVLGGYGLNAVIISAGLRVTYNYSMKMSKVYAPHDQFAQMWKSTVTPESQKYSLVYGRINVNKTKGVLAPDFMRETFLCYFEKVPETKGKHSYEDNATISDNYSNEGTAADTKGKLMQFLFHNTIGNDYWKKVRRNTEKYLAPMLEPTHLDRNPVSNFGIQLFRNPNPLTDIHILHEYFVPMEHTTEFLDALANVLKDAPDVIDILNITIRHVMQDIDCAMNYAKTEVFAYVMYFNQKIEGEEEMKQVTRSIVEVVLQFGGSFYLPYRLHPTADQISRAYPQLKSFFETKNEYDPENILQHAWYERYRPEFKF